MADGMAGGSRADATNEATRSTLLNSFVDSDSWPLQDLIFSARVKGLFDDNT